MSVPHTFTCLFEKGWYSDFNCIINNKEYNLHTKFLINESEFFKCLINNSQMNIKDPLTIIGSNNKIVSSETIDQIIKWFYHNDINQIPVLNCNKIDETLNFNVVLEYYYASDFLQIDKIKKKSLEIIEIFFNILMTQKYTYFDKIKLINKSEYEYKFVCNRDGYFDDIDSQSTFNKFLNEIFILINNDKENYINNLEDRMYTKVLNINKKNYENKFCEIMSNYFNGNFDKENIISQLFKDKRSSMKNMKIFIDDLMVYINKNCKYKPLKRASISLYDFDILLNVVKDEHKKILIKLLRFRELLKDGLIMNEKTLTFERLCKKHKLDSKYRKKIVVLCKDYNDFV